MNSRCLAPLVACAILIPSLALAATPNMKKVCVEANAQAQIQRKAGQLRAAEKSLHVCSEAACPQAVRDDCAQRLDEIERVLPSVVFEAKDGAGHDLSAVHVTMDGAVVAERLDGTPIPLDPGEHTFVFEVAGETAVERKLVIHEGERSRGERVVIGNPPPEPIVAPVPAPTSPSGGNAGMFAGVERRTLGLVVGAAGVVGAGLGGVFGGLAASEWSKAKSDCNTTTCPNHANAVSERSSTLTYASLSTVALVAGGVLLAGGVVIYVTAPKKTEDPHVAIVPSLGGASLVGSF